MKVAALYVRADSVYKRLGCDAFDAERDARNFRGGKPVVAHPPCRSWGRLRKFAKPAAAENMLAVHAIDCVRRWGGVLEHPSASQLWPAMALPGFQQGERDCFGGFSMVVDQNWFGHPCQKRTYLYICGCEPSQLPAYPMHLGEAEFVLETTKKNQHRPKAKRFWRDTSLELFATWLIQVAQVCDKNK